MLETYDRRHDLTQLAGDNQASGNVEATAAEAARGKDRTWPGDVQRFFTPGRLIKIFILGALWIGLFHGTMHRLVRVWLEVPDWSHGPLIPLFSIGILLYIHQRWTGRRPAGSYLGLAVVFFALLANVLAVWWFHLIMLEDYSWWLLLIGMVLTICGWRFTAVVWFPLLFMVFSIRISGQLYTRLQTISQLAAAQASAVLLNIMRVTANLDGVVINMLTRTQREVPLTVAEACSGMRILMAFAALGSLLAYTIRRPWWHRIILVIAILPIAVVANILRITAMGLLYYFDHDSWAEGLAHTLEGLLMLPIAFGLFWLLHKLLSSLIIEDKPDENESAGSAGPPGLVSAAISAGEAAASGLRRLGGYVAWAVRSPREFWRSVGPDLREGHFLALAGVMLVAVVSWNWVSAAMGIVFSKLPVPLKQALDRVPRDIPSGRGGHWVAISKPPGEEGSSGFSELIQSSSIEHFLGATHPYRLRGGRNYDPARPDDATLLTEAQYIQRTYVYVGPDGQADRAGEAYFFISYYTGTPDPVPHVPERCYLGAGWTELPNKIERDVYVPKLGKSVPIRVVQFGKEDKKTTVAYLLCFNGRVSSDHVEVRTRLSNPVGKYAYFAKIELKFARIEDVDRTLEAASALLIDFLPVIEQDFLPDWSKYEK